jgi:O-antigen/teichoic acid export membrane protein
MTDQLSVTDQSVAAATSSTASAAASATAATSATAGNRLTSKVTRDSLWILGNYGVTSLAGFAFWIVAARVVPPSILGVDTAIFSILTAAAAVAATGSGNALLATLPMSGRLAGSVIGLAYRVVMSLGLVTGLIAGILVAVVIHPALPPIVTVLTVMVTTVMWSLFVVKDPMLGGLGEMRMALWINAPANIVKLGLLPAIVVVFGTSGHPLLAAAIAPALIAVIVINAVVLPKALRRRAATLDAADLAPAERVLTAPGSDSRPFAELRSRFLTFTARDGASATLNLGVGLSLSFIVTALAGPSQGAVFAICYQIGLVLDLVVIGVSGSLTINSAGGTSGGQIAFRMWRRVVLTVGLIAAVLIVGAPILLGIFGPYYVANDGVMVLSLLAIGSVIRTAFEVWTGLMRAQHRTTELLVWNAIGAAVLLPAVFLLTPILGAVGAAIGLLSATVVLAVVGMTGLIKSRRQSA